MTMNPLGERPVTPEHDAERWLIVERRYDGPIPRAVIRAARPDDTAGAVAGLFERLARLTLRGIAARRSALDASASGSDGRLCLLADRLTGYRRRAADLLVY